MNISVLYFKVRNLLVSPALEWQKIKAESTKRPELVKYYLLPLILLICLFSFIGGFIFDSFRDSIVKAIILFVANLVSLYFTAYLFHKMLMNMGILTTSDEIFKLIAYSLSAFFLASAIAEIYSSISFFRLIGIYSIVLLWTGIKVILNISEERRIFFTIFNVFIFLITYYCLRIVFFKLLL